MHAQLEAKLLAAGCRDSIRAMTPTTRQKPRAKHAHSLWVSLGWLAVALAFMAYVAALT